jgi:hypothetical protein
MRKKLATMRLPFCVMMLSGWNCTPWMWGYLQAVRQSSAINKKRLNALRYKTATPPGTSARPQLHEGTHCEMLLCRRAKHACIAVQPVDRLT